METAIALELTDDKPDDDLVAPRPNAVVRGNRRPAVRLAVDRYMGRLWPIARI